MKVPLTLDVTAHGRQRTAVVSSSNLTYNLDTPSSRCVDFLVPARIRSKGVLKNTFFLKLVSVWIWYENLFVIAVSVELA
jgi:hypothetical protein